MRCLRLLTFMALFLAALACTDATAPRGPTALTARPPQRALVVPSTIPHVSAGGVISCALKADGTVVCWGYNGEGSTTVPNGLTSVAQLDAGFGHTCALKADATMVCWGYNRFGQSTVPGGLVQVAQVSAGYGHTCALRTDGTVICWGDNFSGQATVPDGLTSVTQVSAGWQNTCALKTDQTVVCWGAEPTGPGELGAITQVSAGGGQMCALMTNQSVACWGYNAYGQATVPSFLTAAGHVSAGDFHSCAVQTGGTAVCWGYNAQGQTAVPGGLGLVTQVSAGGFHSCAVRTNGTVACWGYGGYGSTFVPAGLNLNSAPPNQPPVVGAITGPLAPVQVNTGLTASASFTDPGTLDTHTAVFNWGDGTSSPATLTEASGSGSASGTHAYTATGVYTITLTVTDNDGATAQSVFEFVVVFDPASGFVTGSGSINSPAGAYAPDVTLSGRATFGFVSRYQKGATVPSGNTRFQFHAGSLRFESASYDWLVIAGPQAKFKGSGTINGEGDFGFLLSAVDGDVNGGGGTDKFRIKIWDKGTGGVIYDNQTGTADDAAATTMIEGGNIVIHK